MKKVGIALTIWVEARQASCALSLPKGTFGADQDVLGTLNIDRYLDDDGDDGVWFDIALECSYGGTSQAAVFASSSNRYDYKVEGTNTDKTVDVVGDGGVATDGQLSAVVAADGPYWDTAGFSGVPGSACYDPLLLGVAQLLQGDRVSPALVRQQATGIYINGPSSRHRLQCARGCQCSTQAAVGAMTSCPPAHTRGLGAGRRSACQVLLG